MGESRMRVDWTGVPREDLSYVLPEVKDWIVKGLEESLGEMSLETVAKKLHEGNMQMWVVGKEDGSRVLGVLLTRIQECERTKLLNVYLCGGEEFDSWMEHLEMLQDWGRAQGCEFITVHGRRGWKRKLAPFGFTEKYVMLYKPLFRSH